MFVLGIDTSCDDTSVAVVQDGRIVKSNITHSQIASHRAHGGVVPELASREHLKNIIPVAEEAIAASGLSLQNIDGIAVTIGPGLIGSLLVGVYYAKSLAYVTGTSFIGINHLEGHILSVFLETDIPSFPFICLVVSGGHTSFYEVIDFCRYRPLGHTLDDAAGEAFDKVAKILGLSYPGGPEIEKISNDGRPDIVKFPRALLSKKSFDSSFSGLKTSVSLFVEQWRSGKHAYTDITISDIAASFQEALVDVLVQKASLALKMTKAKSIVVSGGVACNKRLRNAINDMAKQISVSTYFPRPSYCTDNGAMIAAAGYYRLINGEKTALNTDVKSRFPI